MFLQLEKLTLTYNIFAMHNQGSFNFRRPLPPIPPSEKQESTNLWLTLKAFVYRVCDSYISAFIYTFTTSLSTT